MIKLTGLILIFYSSIVNGNCQINQIKKNEIDDFVFFIENKIINQENNLVLNLRDSSFFNSTSIIFHINFNHNIENINIEGDLPANILEHILAKLKTNEVFFNEFINLKNINVKLVIGLDIYNKFKVGKLYKYDLEKFRIYNDIEEIFRNQNFIIYDNTILLRPMLWFFRND